MSGSIVIDRGQCLNSQYVGMNCQRCMAICQAQCITEELDIMPDSCNDCGLCLSVCPSGGIKSLVYRSNLFADLLDSDAKSIMLTCQQSDPQAVWPCLGFLDVRLLLSLAHSGGDGGREIVLAPLSCENCKNGVAEHLQEVVRTTDALLAETNKMSVRWRKAEEPIIHIKKNISRRGFFKTLLNETVQMTKGAVQSGWGENMPRLTWYKNYVGTMAITGEIRTAFFYNIGIGEACNGCGACISICPEKAITAEDYGHSLAFYHHPELCNGCGLCQEYCPYQALVLKEAFGLEKYHVALRQLPHCKVCHEVFQPVQREEVCLSCLLAGYSDTTAAAGKEKV